MSKTKAKEISKGVFMQKYKEKDETNKLNYYIIKIELRIFNVMDFQVDFTGSQNVEVENQTSLVIKTKIEPYVNTVVAKLLLKKSWNLKTKFKFSLGLPDLKTQRKFLQPKLDELAKNIQLINKDLSPFNLANISENNLINFLKSKKISIFIDPEFLPSNNSLGFQNEEEIIKNYDCIVEWRKSKDILFDLEKNKPEKMPYVINEIITDDVIQGKLGNCWLLSAFSCLSENPKLINRLIRTKTPNDYGFYIVKLCKMGDWKEIILDDFFPSFPLGEQIYSKNKSKEIWVMLLEKAFAKFFGSYKNLEVGDCRHSLIDLTGCPTISYKFYQNKIQEMIKNNFIWNKLKDSNKNNFLIAAGTKELPKDNSMLNIVKEHAYSVIRVIEEGDLKLINLRNPWGVFEFSGEWSKNSPLWTDALKNKINPDFESDENFWMTYQDFLNNFETLNVCYTKSWQELKIKGKFVKTVDTENSKITHFCSRWFYRIKVEKRTKAIFGIHQEDERNPGVKELRPYLDIGLSIITYKEGIYKCIAFNDTSFEREVFLEVFLEPGEYFVVPRSLGICLKFSRTPNKIENYDLDNYLVQSFLIDLFNKYDILSNSFLDFKQLKNFYDLIGKEITEKEFTNLIKKYNLQNFDKSESKGLSQKGFLNLFGDFLKNMKKKEIEIMLEKLGYTPDLFSERSRIFNLTIHSDELIKLSVENGLKENIDFVANKLIIRKWGESIDEEKKKNDVDVFCYFNE